MPHILVLYNRPLSPKDHPAAESEHMIVSIAEWMARELDAANYRTTLFGLGPDPGELWSELQRQKPDAILNLYSRGEPADTITVASELDKAGSLSRVGGAVYLHTLMATVPTAANAGFYAQIVAEKAILRRLVEAGTRIVQLGYGGNEGDVG